MRASDQIITLLGGVNASAYAREAAPAGYRWSFVTRLGVRVARLGVPVVALVPIGSN